ncbi:hypothetical protein BCR44DRAFT_54560 [Catenaria anguillulae PL171]|uniref:Transmembrane proteins 14C-domain-containing protein n=1 Tax=Catenaria anguillulae PL171 TaxID=765915 RepID=A0A1Y2HG68_9FUNG|nr:hypothetical protein BCR44DRAFT_54560 [Catenaria anguillulae PL171]
MASMGSQSPNPPNDTLTTKALAPLAMVAEHVDPAPHYFMAGACGIGSYIAHQMHGNPRNAMIAGTVGALYAYSGYLLGQGRTKMGYDIGTVASVGLLAATGRRAMEMHQAWDVSLGSLAAVSMLGNLTKAYQARTDRPHNLPTQHQAK